MSPIYYMNKMIKQCVTPSSIPLQLLSLYLMTCSALPVQHAKNDTFFDYNNFFSQLRVARATFNGLNESWDLEQFQNSFPRSGTPSPYDSSNVKYRKIGFFLFLNPIYGAQRTCQPIFSAQLCSRDQILVLAIQIFGPTGSYPLWGVEKCEKVR